VEIDLNQGLEPRFSVDIARSLVTWIRAQSAGTAQYEAAVAIRPAFQELVEGIEWCQVSHCGGRNYRTPASLEYHGRGIPRPSRIQSSERPRLTAQARLLPSGARVMHPMAEPDSAPSAACRLGFYPKMLAPYSRVTGVTNPSGLTVSTEQST
jgi:hypothetical protein